MESKALLMSWNNIHNSLLLLLASSITFCMTCNGVFVLSSFKPAKFGPERMELSFIHFCSLVANTLTVIFLRHSINKIGHVLPKLYSHSQGFGIGYN